MAMTNDELRLDELSLEPVEPVEAGPPARSPTKFQIDTRGGGDRRKSGERRQTIRFEKDRRQGDRRAKSAPWDRGVDI